MGQPKTKHEVLDREARAWKMRMLGHSEESIAKQLGVTQQAVSRILKRVYDRKQQELETSVAQQKVAVLSRLEWASAEAAAAWERSKKDAEQDKTVTKKQGVKSGAEPPDNEPEPDPEDVEGGLYLGDDGEEIEPEERARRLREAGRKEAEERASLLRTVGMNPDGSQMLTVEEVVTHLTKGQTGNPAHLANVLKATQDVRDLLGLDTPKDAGGGVTVVIKSYSGVDLTEIV